MFYRMSLTALCISCLGLASIAFAQFGAGGGAGATPQTVILRSKQTVAAQETPPQEVVSDSLGTEDRSENAVPLALQGPATRWASGESETVQAIEAALLQPVEFSFDQERIEDVVHQIRSLYEIPIILDKQAMDDLGLSPDEPITFNIAGITLQSALNLMLDHKDLAYTIDNEVLQITSRDRAMETRLTRIYMLAGTGVDASAAHQLVRSHVNPDNWVESEGMGTVTPMDDSRFACIVVSTSYAAHRQIESLLESMRKSVGETGVVYTLPKSNAPYMGGGGQGGGGQGGGMFRMKDQTGNPDTSPLKLENN